MSQTLEDLRSHLFATIEELRDKNKPMDIARAKAIAGVAKNVIDSAKVEVEYLRAIGAEDAELPVLGNVKRVALPKGVNGVKTHRLT